MDDIYMLADAMILSRIGNKLKTVRLKQNITQQSLSETANVSLSSIKKMEKGEIRSFDSLLRVLRILGKLDIFSTFSGGRSTESDRILRLCALLARYHTQTGCG